MVIPFGKLKHLPVVTESGTNLGHVCEIEINTDTHAVRAYLVGKPTLLSRHELLSIAPTQVISVTADRMMVADACVKETAASIMPTAANPHLATGTVPRQLAP